MRYCSRRTNYLIGVIVNGGAGGKSISEWFPAVVAVTAARPCARWWSDGNEMLLQPASSSPLAGSGTPN